MRRNTSIQKQESNSPKHVTDKEADSIFRILKNAKPDLTDDQLYEIDRRITSDKDRVARRSGLLTLTKSGSWLIKNVREDRETAVAFAGAALCLDEYVKQLEALTSIMTTAKTRIRLALCYREDMQDVLTDARKGA